jgi:eukaryotic-like serine/threonine-protein kinase
MPLRVEDIAALSTLLDEALDLPPERRGAWVDKLAEPYAHMRETLRGLLLADPAVETSDFLSTLPGLLIGTDIAEPTDIGPYLHPGGSIGAYELIREIGRGGMGTVWLANRRDKLINRPIALKLPHLLGHDHAAAERFARERDILAALTHPNIARLYDAGLSESGQPFLAMEYVQGVSILEHCDSRRLPVSERLRLFIQIVAAVQYAHAQLVVHRDLKPSNILVTADSRIALLDFGIAKLIAEDPMVSAQLTQLAGPAFTPSYASPEQISGKPLSTASDIYSLGVVLYELLTGVLPYRSKRNSRAALEEAILSADPIRPSQAAGHEQAAVNRGTSTRKLIQLLRDDLDTVLLKALKKSPADRYLTAQAFADDIERHLTKRPVLARPDSALYRAGKFIRRNKAIVSALSVAVATLAVGVTAIAWQAHVAQTQRLRAERVKDFVVSVFQGQDPYLSSSGATYTPQQVVTDAARRLDTELGQDAALHAELLDDLGGIATDLDDLQDAHVLLERAIQERSALFGPNSLPVAQSLSREGATLFRLGRYSEAEETYRRALAILRAHPDADAVETAKAERGLGSTISKWKRATPESESLLQNALHTFEQRLGPEDVQSLRTLLTIAELHEKARDLSRAEPELRELIRRCEHRPDPPTQIFSKALMIQGDIDREAHRYNEALSTYSRAAQIMRAQLGPKHGDLSAVLVRTAFAQKGLRRFDDALSSYQQAEAARPESHVIALGDILLGRGNVELLIGKNQDAERDIHTAYLTKLQASGETSPIPWFVAAEWGRALAANKRFGEAESIERKALERFTALAGTNAHLLATVQDDLAGTLEQQNTNRDEATDLRRQSLRIVESRYPKTHLLWAEYALKLARNLADANTPQTDAEALTLLQQAIADFRTSPADTELLAEALTERARVLIRARDGSNVSTSVGDIPGAPDAREQIREALDLFGRTPYPDQKALQLAQRLERRLRRRGHGGSLDPSG